MNKKIVIVIIILIGVSLGYFLTRSDSSEGLVSPGLNVLIPGQETTKEPAVPAYNPPKEVKYDSSTNLQQQLETVDPQVLDSDFDQLKTLIK